MALRVLLADESSTIKKVMLLALSDFGVEVRSVPVGLDVLSVSKTFKPDIVFADVLLTKRSGYEVCADLKNDSETAHIPVVLMWSGFMDIDEQKAVECNADRRLEKPFDADHLRSIVDDLVPRTQSNPVSSFLTFPDMPEFHEERIQSEPARNEIPETQADEPASYTPAESSLNLNIIPEVGENETPAYAAHQEIEEEFSSVPLTPPTKLQEEIDDGGWSHQDLTKFKIQLPETDVASQIQLSDIEAAEVSDDGTFEEVTFASPSQNKKAFQIEHVKPEAAPRRTAQPATPEDFVSSVEKSVKEQMMETLRRGPAAIGAKAESHTQSGVDLNTNMVENLVREEARAIIESICWKVLPEIAERVVREEIGRILKETEKSI